MADGMSRLRRQPVYFVLLPQTLLLDVAGPAEALRMANRQQSGVRFDVHYVGPCFDTPTSVGLVLKGVAPLPRTLPEDAMVVLAGTVNDPIRASAAADPLWRVPD